jgi:hypothetical protein
MKISKLSLISLVTKKLAIFLFLGALIACGNKGNNEVVDSGPNVNSSQPPITTGIPPIINGNDTSALWEQQKAQHPCRSQYGARLADRHFNVPSNGYYVQGSMADGHAGGSITGIYFGINPTTKDMLRIIQVSDGASTKFNVTTSFCGWNNFISASANMTAHQIYQGVVSNSFNCPVGMVNRAEVYFNSSTYPYGTIRTIFQPISTQCL